MALCWTLVCLAGAAPAVFAQDYQPVPVTISRSQVNLNGKLYYAHIVLERQTIFGITKAYDVTEEDLYAANPMLAQDGLKAGTVIYIPVEKGKPTVQEKPVVKEEKKPVVKEEKPVVKKEDKPAKEKPAAVETKSAPVVNKDGFIEHTVKWFEDIYDVASAYGVTAQEIMDANGLRSSRISKRQILLIPATEEAKESIRRKAATATPVKEPTVAQPEKTDTKIALIEDERSIAIPPEKTEELPDEPEMKEEKTVDTHEVENASLDWLVGNGTAEIALVLPFNASGRHSESNMDFYSGVLMALRDLEKEGVKTTLNVYDLQAGIPSSYDLGKNDVILGPITTTDLTTILGVTGGRIPVVSPLDQRAADLAETHEGFIQAPSSADSQYAALAQWAAEDCARGDQIILVTETTSNGSTAPATGVRKALLAAGTPFEGVSWTVAQGRSLPASLTAKLTKGGVNRIIVASEKEAFVSDIVRNLGILLNRGYKIAMYAPSRVRTFETVDGSLYHQNDMHICSPYFADYDSDTVKSFVRTYRALYRTEPSQFAFQGYDLTRYFVGLCAKYGKGWTRAIEQVTGSGIHTDFHFEKVRNGAYRNTGIRRIVYRPDYSTELVR